MNRRIVAVSRSAARQTRASSRRNLPNTRSAIGYSGLAGATTDVRIVPVVGRAGAPVMPTFDTVLDGSYPIARPLFMFTIGEPQGPVKAYLDWIVGDAGQRVLASKGYPPLRKL